MSSQTIASYLPDTQLIKLGVDLPAFCDSSNPRGFHGVHELGYVFHEWLHYLHNVSTIHGLSAFANLVHLWSVFRQTIGPDGLSMGSASNDGAIQMHFKQKNKFIQSTRGARPNNLAGKLSVELVKVIDMVVVPQPLPGLDVTTSIISCKITVSNSEGVTYPATVEIGPHEIVESVAYMLEASLVRRDGETPKEVPFAPYQLVKMLANHLAPLLSDDIVIACGIAALQDSDPPAALYHKFTFAQAAFNRGEDVILVLEDQQRKELDEDSEWIEKQLKTIEDIFPVDDEMARAVRKTVSTMRSNFNARRQLPFLEIGMVEEIYLSRGNITPLLNAFGACSLSQRRTGFDDDVQRDLLYEFVLDDERDPSLDVGRRLMHAAFDFIRLHSSQGEILPTRDLSKTRRNICPFYTICDMKTRKETPTVCAEEPWQTALTAEANLCWYGRAVRLISPPEIAKKLDQRYREEM